MNELFEYILITLACPLALLMIEPQESDIEKSKPCTNYEDGVKNGLGVLVCITKAESEE